MARQKHNPAKFRRPILAFWESEFYRPEDNDLTDGERDMVVRWRGNYSSAAQIMTWAEARKELGDLLPMTDEKLIETFRIIIGNGNRTCALLATVETDRGRLLNRTDSYSAEEARELVRKARRLPERGGGRPASKSKDATLCIELANYYYTHFGRPTVTTGGETAFMRWAGEMFNRIGRADRAPIALLREAARKAKGAPKRTKRRGKPSTSPRLRNPHALVYPVK